MCVVVGRLSLQERPLARRVGYGRYVRAIRLSQLERDLTLMPGGDATEIGEKVSHASHFRLRAHLCTRVRNRVLTCRAASALARASALW